MNPVRIFHTWLLALVILLFYGGFLVLWFGRQEIYVTLAELWGVGLVILPEGSQAPPFPLFDLYGVLSWRDCYLRGLDVISVNPCDPIGRPSNYSPLWYLLPTGGRANLLPLAVLLVGAFLALLPFMLRPATRTEFVIFALASISPTTLFAVERANPDILMFLMALMAVWLWRSGRGWPAYGVMLVAALLKFYPLALFGLAAREPARQFAAVAAVCSALVALFVAIFWNELARLPALMPVPQYYGNEFGARLFGLAVTEELGLPSVTMPLLTALLVGLCLWGASRIASHLGPALKQLPWDSKEGALMLAGALVTVACFLLMANIGYRRIFLIMVLPGLFLLRRMGGLPAWLAVGAFAAILFCLYAEMFRRLVRWFRHAFLPADRPGIWDDLPEVAFFLVHEAVWWWLVAFLSGLIIVFLRKTPVFEMLMRRAGHA